MFSVVFGIIVPYVSASYQIKLARTTTKLSKVAPEVKSCKVLPVGIGFVSTVKINETLSAHYPAFGVNTYVPVIPFGEVVANVKLLHLNKYSIRLRNSE